MAFKGGTQAPHDFMHFAVQASLVLIAVSPLRKCYNYTGPLHYNEKVDEDWDLC